MYVGSNITVRVRGGVWRATGCGHCGGRFRYYVEKTTVGHEHSAFMLFGSWATRRAEAKARRKLTRLLASATAAVPCPTCGNYQDSMLWEVRRGQFRWMRTNAIVLWCLAPFVFFPVAFVVVGNLIAALLGRNPDDPTTMWFGVASSLLLAVAPGTACYAAWKYRQAGFDPNRDIPEDERFGLALDLARPLENDAEFEPPPGDTR